MGHFPDELGAEAGCEFPSIARMLGVYADVVIVQALKAFTAGAASRKLGQGSAASVRSDTISPHLARSADVEFYQSRPVSRL